MFNFKISGIAAGIAFILSLLIGLFSGAGFTVIFFKAVIFGGIFFTLSCIVYWLINQFIPELLNPPEDDLGFPSSGSKIDISIGDGPLMGAFPIDNSEMVDDIAGKPSTQARSSYGRAAESQFASLPLDPGENSGYNAYGNVSGDLENLEDIPGTVSDAGMTGRGGFSDTLPDMDGLTDGFTGSAAGMAEENAFDFGNSGRKRSKKSSKKPGMADDFNPKELAQAIQTVLKKDEKG